MNRGNVRESRDPFRGDWDLDGWERAGILLPFAGPNTVVPTELVRVNPHDNSNVEYLFLPTSGIPMTLGQDRPREASPTGKSGMGVATYSVLRQFVESARRVFLMNDTDPIYKGTRQITQGTVDPWLTLEGKPTPGEKRTKWTP